jgi:hypothetical protein
MRNKDYQLSAAYKLIHFNHLEVPVDDARVQVGEGGGDLIDDLQHAQVG